MCKPAKPTDDAPAPYDAASLWSRLTYRYALPLFRIGVQRPLQVVDLPSVATRDHLPDVTRRIVEAWDAERQKPHQDRDRKFLEMFTLVTRDMTESAVRAADGVRRMADTVEVIQNVARDQHEEKEHEHTG